MTTLRLYDYPPEHARIDPFDITVDEAQYLVYADYRMTYAWTGRETSFGLSLQQVIDAGRFVLLHTQKISVARDGAVLRQWPRVVAPREPRWPERGEVTSFDDPQREFEYRRDRLRTFCGYCVLNDQGAEAKLADRYDDRAALDAVRTLSARGRSAVALFAYDGESWY